MDLERLVVERGMVWWSRHGGIAQFHRPTGPAGHLAGWFMGRRSSNVARSRWAVEQLLVRPHERVLELGCGPGVALRALAARATAGAVVGVDHSDVVIAQARRRNRRAVRAGRVRLVLASVAALTDRDLLDGDGRFDAALAVNTVGMWPDPPRRLREIGALLRPGGRIAVVSQPRCAGATAATSAAAADELVVLLAGAGFDRLRTARLDLDPPAVCVIGYVAGGAAVTADPADG